MSDLLGIIVQLRKLMSNESIEIPIPSESQDGNKFALNVNREYSIPDFQREIRWEEENVAELIDDLASGPKYLGNIILTMHSADRLSIIDGQQRITVLTMLLTSIKKLHGERINTINPCQLVIESFPMFPRAMEHGFSEEILNNPDVVNSDKLHQRHKYRVLWEYMHRNTNVINQRKASRVLENIRQSTFNIILNKSDSMSDGIRYFIDVNLKGKQLDTEDIFKSYLFKNDSEQSVRDEWYKLKEYSTKAVEYKVDYPLLKFLQHYFFCDLYQNTIYKGLDFGDDFLLAKEFKLREQEQESQMFRQGTHLIELIDNRQYMRDSLSRLNSAIGIMMDIASTDSTTASFKGQFKVAHGSSNREKMDSDELAIIHNLIRKILRDKRNLPKALVMKYILSELMSVDPKTKKDYRKIYGVYLLAVFFTIFESKKSKDILLSVLKANTNEWYDTLISQIKSYFTPEKMSKTRLLAQYKTALNEEEDDYRFRCKSLATIYNFFEVSDSEVRIRAGSIPSLHQFISDHHAFSQEHFIVSDNANKSTKLLVDSVEYSFTYEPGFYNRNVNSLFNFVFIPEELNTLTSNYWLPHKLTLLSDKTFQCEYTSMYLRTVMELGSLMEGAIEGSSNFIDSLYLFFSRQYLDNYLQFARTILRSVLCRISIDSTEVAERNSDIPSSNTTVASPDE